MLRERKRLPGSYPFSVKQIILLMLLCSIMIYILYSISQINFSHFFPIKEVHVYGIEHSDHQAVEMLVKPLVIEGFFNVPIALVREHLLQLPWITEVMVRRRWPEQLDITLIEKKAIARFNHHGLLSEKGELFTPPLMTFPQGLPQFKGPKGSQLQMLENFVEINRLLSPLRVKICLFELTPFASWKMQLNNGIIIQMGHQDILTRIARFVKVYSKAVGSHAKDVDHIDLRYPNGMAVQWKVPVKMLDPTHVRGSAPNIG